MTTIGNRPACECTVIGNRPLGIGGGGSGGANLSITNRGADTLTVASDSGTDATVPAATGTLCGTFTAADKTKLDSLDFADVLKRDGSVALTADWNVGSFSINNLDTVTGGVGASDSLTIDSTTHATKGVVGIAPDGGRVGVGTDAPDDRLHIKLAETGVTPPSIEGGLTIEHASAAQVRFYTATDTATFGGLTFGDPEDNSVGSLYYAHNPAAWVGFHFKVEGADVHVLNETGLGLYVTDPDEALEIDGVIHTSEEATPTAPGAGDGGKWYVKADGKPYFISNTTTETDLTATGSGSPGGSDTQVQFNDGGSTFGGDAGLVYDKTTDILTAVNLTVTGDTLAKRAIGTAITGTSYTFALADANRYLRAGNAATQTLTVPPNSSVAFPIGTEIEVRRYGAGNVVFAQGSGVTINPSATLTLATQHTSAVLKKIGADEWDVDGRLT